MNKSQKKKFKEKRKNSLLEVSFVLSFFSKFKSEKRMLIVDSFYADPRDFFAVVVTLFISYTFFFHS
jgi:C4-dicarboxylate transporter